MKKIIGILSFTMFIAVVAVLNISCTSSASENIFKSENVATDVDYSGIEVYYFHGTRRCATCNAVESVSQETLKEYYGDKVPFKSLNREDKENKKLVKKYNVSGQTLIVVKGNKKVDITNEAFMYARSKPEKLKAKIKEAVEALL